MERPHSKHGNHLTVGLFVFVAFMVATGFVIFMGGSSIFGGEVLIKTTFNDVRGVNVGAPVFLSGIRIGRVSAFQFPEDRDKSDNGNPQIVTVLSIYKDNRKRVRSDSIASIATQGVLGDKVIVITPGSAGADAVTAGTMIASTKGNELGDYLSKGSNLVEKLGKVADNLNDLLGAANDSGKFATVVHNLERTTASLAVTSENISAAKGSLGGIINGGAKDDLGPALKSLKNILAKVDRGEGTLGALVNDSSLHEDLRILLGGARRSQTVRFLLRQAISAGEKNAAPELK